MSSAKRSGRGKHVSPLIVREYRYASERVTWTEESGYVRRSTEGKGEDLMVIYIYSGLRLSVTGTGTA